MTATRPGGYDPCGSTHRRAEGPCLMATPRLPCPGPLDRRSWLKVGGLALGVLAAGLEPSLTRLFAAERAGRTLSKDFAVILFWANGGPSHLDTFDLKPDAPEEIRGPFRPTRTNVPGL